VTSERPPQTSQAWDEESGGASWHLESSTDGQGHTTTRVVTSKEESIREPVELSGPLGLTAGERFERTFELPVPPDGPASLEADDAGLDWTVEAKLDIEGGFDSRIERPVVVVQPTALLRAGAVNLGEFGLYESADVATDGVTGTIALHPMPLVCGQRGRAGAAAAIDRAAARTNRCDVPRDPRATVGTRQPPGA
jgi:hypothetical protein